MCEGHVALARRIAALPHYRAMAPGPCLTRLREYPEVEGLVFGSYGEASPAVYTLLGVLARAIAEREWRGMGARTESEARGIISTQLYRQLCVATVGGHIHARDPRARAVRRALARDGGRRGGAAAGSGGCGGGGVAGSAAHRGRAARWRLSVARRVRVRACPAPACRAARVPRLSGRFAFCQWARSRLRVSCALCVARVSCASQTAGFLL